MTIVPGNFGIYQTLISSKWLTNDSCDFVHAVIKSHNDTYQHGHKSELPYPIENLTLFLEELTDLEDSESVERVNVPWMALNL